MASFQIGRKLLWRQLVSVDALARAPIVRIRHVSLLYPELPYEKTHKTKLDLILFEELPILNINNIKFSRLTRVSKDMGGYRVLVNFLFMLIVTTPPKNFPHLTAQISRRQESVFLVTIFKHSKT